MLFIIIITTLFTGYPKVKLMDGRVVTLRPEKVTFKLSASGGQGSSEGSMSRLQLPLKLAWAISIHKSQVRLTGTYWDLLGPTRTYWDLLGPTGTYWDLLGPTGTYWDLLGPTGTYWDLLGPTINVSNLSTEWICNISLTGV